MFVCDLTYGDLVIWSNLGLLICRVKRNQAFLEKLVEKENSFWLNAILPELQTRELENRPVVKRAKPGKNPALEHDCICFEEKDSEWIGCDRGNDCPGGQWFHLVCMKLIRGPKGNWYCKKCRKFK